MPNARNDALQTLNASTSSHAKNFDQMQDLKEQNQQLKSKMAQLNLALDTIVKDGQSTGRAGRLPPSSGSQIDSSPIGLDNIKV